MSTPPEASSSLPACLVAEAETAGLTLAALTLLDRLVVAAHRAGYAPIIIVSQAALPSLRRAEAWGIPYSVVRSLPILTEPVLVATTGQWILARDLALARPGPSRLLAADGRPLPAGVVPCLRGPDRPDWAGLPGVTVTGPSVPLAGPGDLPGVSRRLWASLTSASDGQVDRYFNRPCGQYLSRWLVHTAVSPNAVSLASIALGLLGAWALSAGTYASAVAGAILFQVSAIVDCVDGDIARAVFKESALGKWIDLVGDQVVHVGVFAGIALGLSRAGSSAPVGVLGSAAIVGALLSFVVVLRGLSRRSRTSLRLQRWMDGATNRDFSVLVLLLALVGHLEIFLWLAAIGSHVFWLIALGLQGWGGRRSAREST